MFFFLSRQPFSSRLIEVSRDMKKKIKCQNIDYEILNELKSKNSIEFWISRLNVIQEHQTFSMFGNLVLIYFWNEIFNDIFGRVLRNFPIFSVLRTETSVEMNKHSAINTIPCHHQNSRVTQCGIHASIRFPSS